ncbi:MAG: hypothetical protein Q9223_001954 [Gallowayella weberi]
MPRCRSCTKGHKVTIYHLDDAITCYDKDNLDVATSGTVRDKKGTFSKEAAASANESSKLQSRASSLKKKAHTLTKQAGQYRKAAAALAAKEAGEDTWETARPPTGTEGLERHDRSPNDDVGAVLRVAKID